MEQFTKEQVKTFVWLAYEKGKQEGRRFVNEVVISGVCEQDPGLSFNEFWDSFQNKVRPDFSMFEDFNKNGTT